MKVGVFLGEFRPEVGGGYTFANDIANAFFAAAGQYKHQFIIFCSPQAAKILKTRGLPANVSTAAIAPRGLLGKAISTLKHLSPMACLLWRFPSALERKARNLGVELIWFVGGFFDTPDIPYIATVWDVQHLTHPWFPEVSAKGVWDYREQFMRRHLKRAMRIITGSHVGKHELTSFYNLPENRIAILPHPTPSFALEASKPAQVSMTKKFGLREGFLLYPAQFWAHKNHISILLALSVLREQGKPLPDIAFVGSDKGNKAHIMNKAHELGLTEYVHFLGFVTTEELVGLYQSAAALVYPSFSGPENLPPLEAFALGCPVLNADFPGAKEQLADAATYFNPHDPHSLANAIDSVLIGASEISLRMKLGKARAQKWVGRDYVQGVMHMIDECSYERQCWN